MPRAAQDRMTQEEADYLYASIPAPAHPTAYYIVPPSDGLRSKSPVAATARPTSHRRNAPGGERTEATSKREGDVLPLARRPALLPFAPSFRATALTLIGG